jgi:hypothetical protein
MKVEDITAMLGLDMKVFEVTILSIDFQFSRFYPGFGSSHIFA